MLMSVVLPALFYFIQLCRSTETEFAATSDHCCATLAEHQAAYRIFVARHPTTTGAVYDTDTAAVQELRILLETGKQPFVGRMHQAQLIPACGLGNWNQLTVHYSTIADEVCCCASNYTLHLLLLSSCSLAIYSLSGSSMLSFLYVTHELPGTFWLESII